MEKVLKQDLNKMKIIMLIISIITFIIYLSQTNISWNIELQPINDESTPIGSIPGWIFAGCMFGGIYYAYLCLLSMIIWTIFNRKNKEALQSYTITTKSGRKYTNTMPSKYDAQIENLWFRFLNYICILEVVIVTFMYMFGIIKI